MAVEAGAPVRLESGIPLVYRARMGHTTIKVTNEVRDRLALLAKERGCTIGEIVGELALATLTEGELEARRDAAVRYIREHMIPDFGDDDMAAAEQLWQDLAAGRVTTLE